MGPYCARKNGFIGILPNTGHIDLFWAIRGAGANFGVINSWEMWGIIGGKVEGVNAGKGGKGRQGGNAFTNLKSRSSSCNCIRLRRLFAVYGRVVS